MNLRRNIFVESSVRANFFVLKTAHRVQVRVDDGLVAGVAAVRPDIVLGAVAAADAVFVAGHALAESSVIVFSIRAFVNAEGSVFCVLAFEAVIGGRAGTGSFALLVALHALTFTGTVQAHGRVAALNTFKANLQNNNDFQNFDRRE